ncbi:substrate-binding domain-containing protein [Hoeflea sp. WL0058]|uniref:Substrate-binding domain-containing protein n=1 Tax=Flavimaribacter sediminis TaxID=2865987 RepID=A0AAE2ZMH6_9HYPH|nr:substrate-binding domain-containing protein [Flavimaribacter sediminis]MBW8637380.1 substrate-binding domain-containing protein [Flavimaribacter sediminis]
MNRHLARFMAVSTVVAMTAGGAMADDFIVVQSTTSTQNSGLYDYILPIYEDKSGVQIRVVAVGTGQAIKNARNCDGDVLLVHAKPAEEKFVAEGYGVERTDLMYNDFIIVGPPADPAGVKGMKDASTALNKIADSENIFVSRGDDSGTNKKEVALWKAAGVDPSQSSGQWYRETGSGMGATLNATIGMDGYTMTDRATWIAFGNKADHEILVEGDKALFNQYGVILVDSEKCPRVKSDLGQAFVDWMLSDEGQKAIASYRLDGKQLFFPNAPNVTN